MLKPETFRRLALGFEDTVEQAHMGHPDFRRAGRIFATLGYPDDGHGMVRLPAADQDALIVSHPEAFRPAPGKWGAAGATLVRLARAPVAAVRTAMGAAWRSAGRPARRTTAAAASTRAPKAVRASSRSPRTRR